MSTQETLFRFPTRILGLLALLLILPFASSASAQQASPPDSQELEVFVETYVDIQEVREDVERQMALVTSEEEAAALQAQANERMGAALEENDFTIERYTEITNILNADEELRLEFQQKYQEALEERDPGSTLDR
jgi:hypothetical protein